MPKYPGIRKKHERWYYRLQYHGHRIEKGSFTSAELAHRARLAHLKELQRHQVTPHNFTVEQLIVKYIEEHEKVYNRAPTAVKNEGICRNHIIPLIGSRRIADLKPSDMRQFQNHLFQNQTPSVAYNTMRTIKKIFNWAVE
jgi:hypothetical protein